MIQKNELRIGNWLGYKDKGYTHYFQIKEGSTIDEVSGDEAYNPIPLTDEILDKAGFTKRWADSWETVFIEIDKSKYGGYVLLNGEERSHWRFAYKYLHQLQNLHFALTGEELTINL